MEDPHASEAAIQFRVGTKVTVCAVTGSRFWRTDDLALQFTVKLIDLRRAFRRLLVRLPDESEAGGDSVVFRAIGDSLEIAAGTTSEVLHAAVAQPGEGRIPHSVFQGIGRSLPFHRGRFISASLSPGVLRIDHTDYRHPGIFVQTADRKHSIRDAKPQNL